MTIKLAYPTIASPITLVSLSDVENMPSSRPRRVYQSVFETDAGTQVIYDWGDNSRTFSLDLWPLNSTDAQAVEDFFYKAEGSGGVNGRAGQWQLEDTLGNQYTVKFAQDVIEAIRRTNAFYAISITVREQ